MHYTSPEVYKYISKQTNDPIIERKTCSLSWTQFAIFQSDLDFYNKISPVFNEKKYTIPTPTLCPEERQRRRLMFRNERKLYKRKCDATGESIISIYSPNNSSVVYNIWYRLSDKRDAMKYWESLQDNESIFTQLKNLHTSFPQPSLINLWNENAEYGNHSGWNKDCYLIFYSDYNEWCCYLDHSFHNNDCYDSSYTNWCISCYSTMSSRDCRSSTYVENSSSCNDIHYSDQCIDCEFCILCTNQSHKKYCFNNKQYTKEEYLIHKQTFDALSIQDKFLSFFL